MAMHHEQIDLLRAAKQLVDGARLFGVDAVPTAERVSSVESTSRSASQDAAGGVSASGERRSNQSAHTSNDQPERRLAALRSRYSNDTTTAAHIISGWTNTVFDTGNPRASVLFVGEAPGADEDREGIPFVGRAGQLLTKMLTAMGLSRETVYIANVLKVRPPGNRDPSAAEKAADGPYLLEEIEIVSPDVLVTLGRPATNFILDRDVPIGSVRGTWQSFSDRSGRVVPVMPTYHPAYLLRAYTDENRRKVWSDLQQVMQRASVTGA